MTIWRALGIFSVIVCLSGCQAPASQSHLQSRLDQRFLGAIPISEVVANFNDDMDREIRLNAEAGQAFAEAIVAAKVPPMTEEEFISALRVAHTTKLQEAVFPDRPKAYSEFSQMLIERMLRTRTVPKTHRILVQVTAQNGRSFFSTYIPTIRLGADHLVIRKSYLRSRELSDDKPIRAGAGWLDPRRNRIGSGQTQRDQSGGAGLERTRSPSSSVLLIGVDHETASLLASGM